MKTTEEINKDKKSTLQKTRYLTHEGELMRKWQSRSMTTLWASEEGLRQRRLAKKRFKKFYKETEYVKDIMANIFEGGL